MWDLFEKQPLLLEHPTDIKLAVAAVSKVSNTFFVWWSADYLIDVKSTGFPGSGFPKYPMEGKLYFDKRKNSWNVKERPDWIYRFYLPTEKMMKEWPKVKQYVPTVAELQARALEIYADKRGN